MKKKPDISSFNTPNSPKDPTAFLEGSSVDRAEKSGASHQRATPIEAAKPEPTVQKIFRLRWDVANALRIHVAQQCAVTGKRVTEKDVVEQLLRDYLDI